MGEDTVPCHKNCVKSLLVVSRAMQFDKIRHMIGSCVADEVFNLLNQENFNLSLVKAMVKGSGDSRVIIQDKIVQ